MFFLVEGVIFAYAHTYMKCSGWVSDCRSFMGLTFSGCMGKVSIMERLSEREWLVGWNLLRVYCFRQRPWIGPTTEIAKEPSQKSFGFLL